MVNTINNIKLGEIYIDPILAKEFAIQYDYQKVHTNNNVSNNILPKGAVSGLYVLCLLNRLILSSNEYKGILCARQININFKLPILSGEYLNVYSKYFLLRISKKYNAILRHSDFYLIGKNKNVFVEIMIEHFLELKDE